MDISAGQRRRDRDDELGQYALATLIYAPLQLPCYLSARLKTKRG